jgi:hypothetical protein
LCEDFGFTATVYESRQFGREFEFYTAKFDNFVLDVLQKFGLVWSNRSISSGHQTEFKRTDLTATIHPRLGEIIMSTIAIACAEESGASIVTDNQQLHEHLLAKNATELYNELIFGDLQPPAAARPEDVWEVLFSLECDASELTVERIRAIGDDREAIHALLEQFRLRSIALPAMADRKIRMDALAAIVEQCRSEWRLSRRNMAPSSRRLFRDVSTAGKQAFEATIAAVTEKSIENAVLSAGFTHELAAAAFGHFGASFSITFLKNLISGYSRPGNLSTDPLRCFTMLDEAGVYFRAELPNPNALTAPL